MLACGTMRKRLNPCLLSLLWLSAGLLDLSSPAAAQEPSAPPPTSPDGEQLEPADRILAVVDEDPILASDVEQVVGLGLVAPVADEDPTALRRRVLDMLIEQKLRFHEIDQFGFVEVPVDEVESQLAAIRAEQGGSRAFAARLEELGLDEQSLRQILARQIMVLIFVEERLGARVFVDLEDIKAYYEDELVPRLRSSGADVPPLNEVREQIRQVLKEQRLNEEILAWTDDLRLEADIVDYFDSAHSTPPDHLVSAEEAPPGG